jgi:hypothetical protein
MATLFWVQDGEEAAAEQHTLEPEVSAHRREMGRLGADVKGEGQID